MSVTSFSPEQQAAIDARGASLLLSANAGSGKTGVMVECIVRSVLDDELPLARVLAITFTEKAAAELRSRVHDRLLALDQPDLALDVDGAWISTIHGCCARLLRMHALSAGIDPAFAVLDARAAERLEDLAIERALADLVVEYREPAVELVAAYRVRELRALIPALHDQLRARGEREPSLAPAPPGASPGATGAELARACAAAAAELGELASPGATVLRALTALEACAAALAAAGADVARPATLAGLELPTGAAALASATCERYRAALAAHTQALVDHHARPAWELLAALLAAYAAHYAALKRARSGLDFDDLELELLALLERDDELRVRIAEGFDRIVVDEYQDTSPLQARLLALLGRDNVLAVGDELQSIYGFRHADVDVIRALRARLEPRGRTLPLTANYRSEQELLDALNLAFAPIFGSHFQPLVAGHGPAPRAPAARVELLVTDLDGWDDGEDETAPGGARAPAWRRAEARFLAERVRALLDCGAHRAGEIVVLLRATGDLHTFERALLDADVPTYVVGGRGYWAQREVRDLLAYLAVIANPRDEPALYEVLASPLVGASSDALTLLAAAGRARGDGPWPALLASVAPEAGEPSELARALPEVDRGALAAFARLLLEERAGAPRRPLEALLGRALAATDYDLTLLGRPHGARRLANVRKLLRLAREYEAGEGRELRGFLEHVERLGGDLVEQDRESEAPVSADGLDAVRLMTIHRAKGLEFPVVCVADLGRGARGGPDALVRLEDDGRVGLQLLTLDEAARRPAFAYAALGDEQRAREAEEERRLFYVAMTRAEGRLILSGAIRFDPWPAPRPGEPPIAWIAPALVPEIGAALAAGERFEGARTYEGRRVRVSVARNRSADEAARGVPARQPSGADAPRERAGAPAGPAPDARPPAPTLDLPPPPARASRLSYSALQSHARCGYRFYVERELGLPATPSREPRAPAGAQLPAALRGTLVHALLERLDFGRPAALEAHAVRELAAAHGARATDADVADLSELVARFAASPLCARLAAAAGVRREAGFLFALGAGGTGTLLSGVVDVLAREPGGTLIVDYKSDRVGTQPLGELVERSYGIQQRVYALAALRAGAATVEIAHCFLERPAEPVLARFDPSDVAALEGALAPLAERVALRDFPVSRAPGPWVCDGCPARGSLCSWPLAATIGEPA